MSKKHTSEHIYIVYQCEQYLNIVTMTSDRNKIKHILHNLCTGTSIYFYLKVKNLFYNLENEKELLT